jgi:Skp family chaperone for outer membrane proteins
MKRLITLFLALPLLAWALPAQATIGCVDVERCLSEYNKAKEQRKQLKDEIDEKVRGLAEERRKIEALKDTVDLYIEGSKEWLDLMKKIELGMATIKLESRAFEIQYAQRLAEIITKLYEDVRREIKNVAEAKGMKMVLMYVSSMPKGRTETDVTNNIMVRPVLYHDPSADITTEVVNRLNK